MGWGGGIQDEGPPQGILGGCLAPTSSSPVVGVPEFLPVQGGGAGATTQPGHTPVEAVPEGPSLWREGPRAPQGLGKSRDCCQLPYVRFGQVVAPLNASFLTGTMGFKT